MRLKRLAANVAAALLSLSAGAAVASVPDGIYNLSINGISISDVVVTGGVAEDERLKALPLPGAKTGRLIFDGMETSVNGDQLDVSLPAAAFATTEISFLGQASLAPALVATPLSSPWINYAFSTQTDTKVVYAFDGVVPTRDQDAIMWRVNGGGISGSLVGAAAYVQHDPEARVQTVYGFNTSAYNGLTAPVRYVGFGKSTNYGLYAPGFVTAPSAMLQGSAAMPSTVEVFINGQRALTKNIQPGPFSIRDIPSYGSNSDVRVIVRDALGREQVLSAQLSGGPALLKKGIADHSFNFGALQRGDTEFGPGFVSAGYRVGVTDDITFGGAADGDKTAQRVFGTGTFGTVIGTASAALGLQSTGAALLKGAYTWQGRIKEASIFVNAAVQQPHGEFRELGRDTPVSAQRALTFGGSFASYSASFAYASDSSYGDRTSFSASKGYVFASFTRPATNGENSFFVGVNFPIDGRITGGATTDSTRSNVYAGLNREGYTGVAARANIGRAINGASNTVDGYVSYAGDSGTVELGASQYGGVTQFRGTVSGSIVMLPDEIRFARRINQTFALVETGEPNANVTMFNSKIAETDKAGRALIPEVTPFLGTGFNIETSSLEDRLDGTSYSATMPVGRGAVITWPRKSVGVFVLTSATQESEAEIDGKPGYAVAKRGVWADDLAPGRHEIKIGKTKMVFDIPIEAKEGQIFSARSL